MSTRDVYAEQAMHNNKISGLAAGSNPDEAVNFGQLGEVAATIQHVTVSPVPPVNPHLNDLWVDLSA